MVISGYFFLPNRKAIVSASSSLRIIYAKNIYIDAAITIFAKNNRYIPSMDFVTKKVNVITKADINI